MKDCTLTDLTCLEELLSRLIKEKFSDNDIENIEVFRDMLLEYNSRYNLISKNTENTIWLRHILDSAQLIRHFKNDCSSKLVDLGSGAGFPGFILAIFNKNPEFHVKLYEKSPVKRGFLESVKKKIRINVEIADNIYDKHIEADIIVCRAFKKLVEIIQVSREIVRTSHKLIVLKGQNAQEELNKAFKNKKYHYKIESSMTSKDSKIVIINFNK